MNKLIDPRTCVFYLLHYPLVRFRALLIRDMLDNTFIFSDKDFPGHFDNLSKSQAQRLLNQRPDILDLTNPHHVNMIESFGLIIDHPVKEVK